MPLDVAAVLAEIDAVLARFGASKDRPQVPRSSGRGPSSVSTMIGNRGQIVSACVAAIERNAPQRSYIETAHRLAGEGRPSENSINALIGVLVTVRDDIEAGYIQTLEQRTRETVFDDFLEMASEINTISPPSAVVLAVSVLEEHVRNLADVNGITTVKPNGRFRSFEDMTTDLKGAQVLSLPEYRLAGGWYALRTEAAHGRFENVVAGEVPRVIDGVREFLVRHPA